MDFPVYVRKRTLKYPKVPESMKKVPKITKVPKSTQKYLKLWGGVVKDSGVVDQWGALNWSCDLRANKKADLNENVHISILNFFWRVSVNMKLMTDQVSQKRVEDVSMKWIDRQIAKKKREMPSKLIQFYKILIYRY